MLAPPANEILTYEFLAYELRCGMESVSGPSSQKPAMQPSAPDPAQPCSAPKLSMVKARLRRHADYQRVYKNSRKQQSQSMSYFYRLRNADDQPPVSGPRVGLTAGRVLGKAVERNRIKRRLREAVRLNLSRLSGDVDVVLHPRKPVLDADFAKLQAEVARIFVTITETLRRQALKESQKASQP